jgi:type I restriction enzyme S subunit
VSVPPYASYQESGLEWLGNLPSHWDVKPMKAVTSCNDEVLTEATAADYELEYVEISDVQAGEGITGSTTYTFGDAPSRARRRLRDGDVLVSTVRTYLRAIAQVCQPEDNLIASTGFAVLRPRTAHSDFLGYAIQLEGTINQIIARSVGVSYPAINASDLVRIPVPVPPLAEQIAIAAFLDRETGKIDALVEAQRRLIELLKEKRQAVISHAVTKGLDPTAPMKDSGVEWLGSIPDHWEIGRLSTEAHFFQGKAHEPFVDDDGEHICVTARFVSTSGQSEKLCSKNLSPAKLGDILMVMSDLPNGRALARAYLVADNRSYAVNQRVCAISIRRGDPRFFAYQLNRNMQLLQFNDGVEQTHLKNGAFTRLLLAVPPADEQRRLADQIDLKVAEWDQLTTEAERAVILLQDRRSALISAAVTGKIDVRGLVPEQLEAV